MKPYSDENLLLIKEFFMGAVFAFSQSPAEGKKAPSK